MNEEPNLETALQAKIRQSLKQHPQKPVMLKNGKYPGVLKRYRAVAKEVGCSIGAVQSVESVERAFEIGKQAREQRLEPLPFDIPQTSDVNALVKDFPGWVFAFGKLSLLINCYLQIARVLGATMPGAWLEDLRGICENAQRRSSEDAALKKLWPNGAPPGSGHFKELHGPRDVSESDCDGRAQETEEG